MTTQLPIAFSIGKIDCEIQEDTISLKTESFKVGIGLTRDELTAARGILELECRANVDTVDRERLRELMEHLLLRES